MPPWPRSLVALYWPSTKGSRPEPFSVKLFRVGGVAEDDIGLERSQGSGVRRITAYVPAACGKCQEKEAKVWESLASLQSVGSPVLASKTNSGQRNVLPLTTDS